MSTRARAESATSTGQLAFPVSATVHGRSRGPCCVQASTSCMTVRALPVSKWHYGKLDPYVGKDVCSARACREAAGCLDKKRKRADGSRVSRKRQAAGRATYYEGTNLTAEQVAARHAPKCPLCMEPQSAFFTKNKGHGRIEPACECSTSQSCCYSCLYDWAVLHALEEGRVDKEEAQAPLRCMSCNKEATRLLSVSKNSKVVSDVAVPYEFPSSAIRLKMARGVMKEHNKGSSWLRLVGPMKPPPDIATEEFDFRCRPPPVYPTPHTPLDPIPDLSNPAAGGTTPMGCSRGSTGPASSRRSSMMSAAGIWLRAWPASRPLR